MLNNENIPNLLNDINDEDQDAFYSRADESNAFSEYGGVYYEETYNDDVEF